MTEYKQSHSLLKGAFLLTIAGLIGKVLSVGYRIPLQNIAGDFGFYIYQQVYPVLGMALILSLYGFPAAISKLVSELRDEQRPLSFLSFYLPTFLCLMGICGVIFLTGYTQAHRIAAVMGDMNLVLSLQVAFFVFLFVPFTSLIRGVFQGLNNMHPTAVSQVIEQVIRVTIILLTAVFFIRQESIYLIGVGSAIGSLLGSVGAILFLIWIAKKQAPWSKKSIRSLSFVYYIKTILFYGLFICLNYMLLLLLQFIDSLTLVPGLVQANIEYNQAKVLKGVFDRGQPLIQLGTVLASSVALALIPTMTRKRLRANREKVHEHIYTATKYSFLLASGATVGLIVLFPVINQLFFQDVSGTSVLRLSMVVILFSSLAITTSSVLQGLGYVTQTALLVIGGVLIKGLGNFWLIPLFELKGAAVASIICVAFVMVGNIMILSRELPFKEWRFLPWGACLIALMGMTLVLLGLAEVEYFIKGWGRVSLLFYTLFLTVIGAVTYFLLLIRLGAVTQKELEPLPYKQRLIGLLPKGMKL